MTYYILLIHGASTHFINCNNICMIIHVLIGQIPNVANTKATLATDIIITTAEA